MHRSLILRLPRERTLEVREGLLLASGGSVREAFLLSILEWFTNREHAEQATREERNKDRKIDGKKPVSENKELWVRRTPDELAGASFGIFSDAERLMQAARSLEDKGLVVIDEPFRDEGSDQTFLRLHLENLNDRLRQEIEKRSSWDAEHERMAASIADARRGDARDRYGSESWQYRYAERWWQRMEDLGRIRTDWRERKEKILQKWADAFDYCIRAKDYDRGDIDLVLTWLFQWDDFWIENNAILAPTKFKTTLSNDSNCIVHMVQNARTKRQELLSELPEDGETISEWALENKIVETFGEDVREYFQSAGYGTGQNSDQKVYTLTAERETLI
jgi:hypothetical protein